jgi:hypothetical protein
MDVLMPVADRFPTEWVISYNLACYTRQLGQPAQAFKWLENTIDLAGKGDISMKALDHPDLQPFWAEIGAI